MHAGKGYLEPLKELVKDAQRLKNHVAWALADFLLANGMAPESARLTAEECLPLIARELLRETGGDPQKLESDLRLYRRMREKSQSSRQA